MAKKKTKRLVHPQYKKAKDLPGTGWLIIIAFMLIVMFVMAGLESSGIYEIPKWFIYIFLAVGIYVLHRSSGPLSWIHEFHYEEDDKDDEL